MPLQFLKINPYRDSIKYGFVNKKHQLALASKFILKNPMVSSFHSPQQMAPTVHAKWIGKDSQGH